ncbi:methyltransferase-like protein 22 [Osmerus mordax]|uniref:methyltransferase-like protein 22 n=1 Tax=Osmerus mordax TaxID=8014 RepID=UPI0035104045
MDQITYRHDTVLSDVHMLLPNARHLMTRLNRGGQPVFISWFKIIWEDGEKQEACNPAPLSSREDLEKDTQERDASGGDTKGPDGGGNETEAEGGGAGEPVPVLDDDGDLEVARRPRESVPMEGREGRVFPIILSQASAEDEEEDEDEDQCPRDVIRIEHTMATPLEDVGKQVWRAAFLLADLILSEPATFRETTVLELGSGTGLTSIVMAIMAKTVYCTDIGDDLLSMCQRNMTLNQHLLEPTGGDMRVRELDWLRHDLCTDGDTEFGWTEEEVADLYDNTTFIIAADVCYDDDLTDGFFKTVYRLCDNFHQACTVYVAIEKRLNFTLRHMDVSCEAYDHFRHCLSKMQEMMGGRTSFKVQQVAPAFPQHLQYERIEQLELWKVIATPVRAISTGSGSFVPTDSELAGIGSNPLGTL